jgi:hypothetical protein
MNWIPTNIKAVMNMSCLKVMAEFLDWVSGTRGFFLSPCIGRTGSFVSDQLKNFRDQRGQDRARR